MSTILLLSIPVMLMARVPVAFAMGTGCIFALVLGSEIPLMVGVQRMFTAVDVFPLLAIPFFMLAGSIMNGTGVSKRLVKFSEALVGHLPGGLAMVNIVASMFFAGMSGSSTADTAGIGSILIPTMKKRGYSDKFSVAVTAASSTIGVIIPPSIPMVIFGTIASVSIGSLFLGGFLPGVLITVGQSIVAYFISKKRRYPVEEHFSLKILLKSFIDSLPALMLPLIILGGIFSGLFTPTEAAVIAVVYATVLGVAYKEINLKKMVQLLKESATILGPPLITLTTASLLGWILVRAQAPLAISAWLSSISKNPLVILLIINIIYLIMGTFMDMIPAMLITVPVFLPIAVSLGINPIHFGIVTVMNFAIGLITPPVGVCLYIACSIGGTKLEDAVKEMMPFFWLLVVVLLFAIFFPSVILFLPKLLLN
jgi:C4-dicarboxylate transporter DctM subunit